MKLSSIWFLNRDPDCRTVCVSLGASTSPPGRRHDDAHTPARPASCRDPHAPPDCPPCVLHTVVMTTINTLRHSDTLSNNFVNKKEKKKVKTTHTQKENKVGQKHSHQDDAEIQTDIILRAQMLIMAMIYYQGLEFIQRGSSIRQYRWHFNYSQICPNGHLCYAANLFLSLCSTFPIKTICPKRPSVLYGH
jgi:hypothetical protein